MKRLLPLIVLGAIALSGCSQADRDNRRAAIYAEQLERGEAVSAQDYAAMVDFYCTALDRALADIDPAAREHAAAIDANDSTLIAQTDTELRRQSARTQKKRPDLMRLGSNLQARLMLLPDSTRNHLMTHLMEVSLRYSDFH